MPHPLVVHVKKSRYDVYVGRGSKWGNPYSHHPNAPTSFRVATRAEAVEAFEIWIHDSPLIEDVHELRGLVLGCWCAPALCHADVLARLAGGGGIIPRLHFSLNQ